MERRRKAWLMDGDGVLVQRDKRLPGYYCRFYEYRPGGGRKNPSKHFSPLFPRDR